MNKAGQFLATDQLGIALHAAASESIVDTATRQANGTFGPLTALWTTPNNSYSGGQIARALDLNNIGQALGVDTTYKAYGTSLNAIGANRDFFLYNLNTGVRTDLASLLPIGWYPMIPIALDDQGRILVVAESTTSSTGTELFLLTPAGLSSNPIPAPEPTTFVTLAVAGIGLAVRRWWKS